MFMFTNDVCIVQLQLFFVILWVYECEHDAWLQYKAGVQQALRTISNIHPEQWTKAPDYS